MKIAVVGSGIAGLGSAWLLGQKHEVHLFEAEERLGGHAHTVQVKEAGFSFPVDTGFLVYNELTYPHLMALFAHLGVEAVDSDMSLSVQVPARDLEWNGTNLNSVFGQRRNLLRPSFYRMLAAILRFAKEAEESLLQARRHGWSLGELMKEKGYSSEFQENYLLPIGAAIWSTPEKEMLRFPAETFLQFFINHHLLQVNGRPIWRTVKNGSAEYVKRMAAELKHVHLSAGVQKVERRGSRYLVKAVGQESEFDAVVFATHPPTTLKILDRPSDLARNILGAFRFETNRAVLHQDRSFLPKRPRCWASWNVYGAGEGESRKVSLTYLLNRLQPLPTKQQYLLTLNPLREPDRVIQEISYEHPQFDRAAIQAQGKLPSLQGENGLFFAGAWTRYGFHEDGLLSAVKVAAAFGILPPWEKK